MARFRRAGLLDGCGAGVTVSRALTAEDLRAAYALVHDVFVAQGFIRPSDCGMRIRPFEALPEMATFVAKADGRVVAVLSVVEDTDELGLPSDQSFLPELDALRQNGRRVCEITNLAVHPDYRKTPVFFDLTRCCFAHAIVAGYDDLFIAISPEHAVFFEDVLLFVPHGERRSYSAKILDIVEGKRLDLVGIQEYALRTDRLLGDDAFLEQFFFTGNPYHQRMGSWISAAQELLGDPGLLLRLFIHEGNLLPHCTLRQLRAILKRWAMASLTREGAASLAETTALLAGVGAA